MSHTHFTQGIPSPPACKIRSTEVRDRGQTASANTHGSRPATAAQNRGRQRSGPGARSPSPPPSSSLGPRAAGRGEDILSPPSSPEDLGEGGARNSPLPGAAAAKFRGPQAGPGQLLGVSECPIPAGGELALGRGAVSGGCSLPGTQAVPSLPDCKAPRPHTGRPGLPLPLERRGAGGHTRPGRELHLSSSFHCPRQLCIQQPVVSDNDPFKSQNQFLFNISGAPAAGWALSGHPKSTRRARRPAAL